MRVRSPSDELGQEVEIELERWDGGLVVAGVSRAVREQQGTAQG